MVEKSHALQAASSASVARLEDTQAAYKGSVVAFQERLEASVKEINRGNAIIQKLQGQYRALRTKAKLKSEVIKQQVNKRSLVYQTHRAQFLVSIVLWCHRCLSSYGVPNVCRTESYLFTGAITG